MAETKSTTKPSKVMDVARPGKTAPPASAKPIIVTNRLIIKQDPMMVSTDAPAASMPQGRDPAELVSRASKQIRIEPLSHDETSALASAPTSIKVTDAAVPPEKDTTPPVSSLAAPEAPGKLSITPYVPTEATAAAAAESTPDPAPTLEEPATPEKESAPESQPAAEPPKVEPPKVEPPAEPTPADSPAREEQPAPAEEPAEATSEEADTDDKQLPANQTIDEAKKKEEEAKAAKVAEQEKIIASRKYYLPISMSKQRRGFWIGVLLLLIVLFLAAVWLDVALDAGIVHISGLHPLTHFFNLQ